MDATSDANIDDNAVDQRYPIGKGRRIDPAKMFNPPDSNDISVLQICDNAKGDIDQCVEDGIDEQERMAIRHDHFTTPVRILSAARRASAMFDLSEMSLMARSAALRASLRL